MNLLNSFFRRLAFFSIIFSLFTFNLHPPVFSLEFDNTNILVQEAVNHIYQKRYKQAHQSLKQAYEQSPRHPGVHFNLGHLFELTGNPQEALREYQLASTLDQSMVAAKRGIARCSVELKRLRSLEQTEMMSKTERDRKSVQAKLPSLPIERQLPPPPLVVQMERQVQAPPPAKKQVKETMQLVETPSTNNNLKKPEKEPVKEPEPVPSMPPTTATVIQTTPHVTDEPPATVAEEPTQTLTKIDPPKTSSQAPTGFDIQPPSISELSQPSTTTSIPSPQPNFVPDEPQDGKTKRETQAENLIEKGSINKAIDLLEAGSDEEFNSPRLLVLLGKAYSLKGNIFEAIKHLEEAIRINEHYYAAYYLLAQNYAKVNLLDDAMKNYLIYFGVKPQASVAVEIARIYERMGKPEQAKDYYSKANVMNPGNPNLQDRVVQTDSKMANDLYLRANHAFTLGDFGGALGLFQQAVELGGLDETYQRDVERKISISKLRVSQNNQKNQPAQEGFKTTRKIYGTVNLRYPQLADIKFHTKFIDPVTVEWRGFIARSFTRYGQDFFVMIKELSLDELDEMRRDKNDFNLNPNYTNQPIFLLTALQGKVPNFIKVGAFITFTGRTDWRFYDVINDLGQSIKLPAFEYISAHP